MITVTTNALHQIKKLITSRENIPAGIKVGINTKGCSGLSYTLEYVDQIDVKDEVFQFDDIKVFIDPKSSLFLIGTEVDYVEGELESTYASLAQMADKVGFDKQRLVRHYAPPTLTSSITQGVTPSVLIGKGAIEEVLATAESSSHGFLLETDYMDDLRRPGAVLGPKTVPKRTQQLLQAGIDESFLWKAHQELPDLLYGPSE